MFTIKTTVLPDIVLYVCLSAMYFKNTTEQSNDVNVKKNYFCLSYFCSNILFNSEIEEVLVTCAAVNQTILF